MDRPTSASTLQSTSVEDLSMVFILDGFEVPVRAVRMAGMIQLVEVYWSPGWLLSDIRDLYNSTCICTCMLTMYISSELRGPTLLWIFRWYSAVSVSGATWLVSQA